MFERCPKAWLRDSAQTESALVSDVVFFLDHKVLPCEGGMLDQDPRFLEALNYVDATLKRHQTNNIAQLEARHGRR